MTNNKYSLIVDENMYLRIFEDNTVLGRRDLLVPDACQDDWETYYTYALPIFGVQLTPAMRDVTMGPNTPWNLSVMVKGFITEWEIKDVRWISRVCPPPPPHLTLHHRRLRHLH